MTSVAKDFHRLMKRVGKLTDGQATIMDIDWDDGNLQRFHIVIQPNSGLYKNGKFKFEINIPLEYPESAPMVWCHTDIYHPNIDQTEDDYSESSTNVCLNLLENGVWSKSYGLEGTVLGLLFLMHNPNLQDPLSPYFEGNDDDESFRENVRKYMAGEEFDDISFNTGFCVKDGVLIEDIKADTSGNTDGLQTVPDAIDTEKQETDMQPASATDLNDTKEDGNETQNTEGVGAVNEESVNSTPAVDDRNNGTVVNKAPTMEECNNCVHKNEYENKDSKAQNCDENTAQDTTEVIVEINDTIVQANNTVNNQDEDENSDTEIELVNLDGEFLLFVHTSDDTTCLSPPERNSEDSDIENDPSANTSDPVIGEDSNTNLLPQASGSCSRTDKNDAESDSNSISNQTTCHCGPWSTVKSVLCKFVHAIVHHKLYRDIGI